MAKEATGSGGVAPVVSYISFKNFFDKMKAGIPGRIDRSALKYTSGAIGTQLIHAFRALKLTDEQGHPNAKMEALAAGYAAKDKASLKDLLRSAYPGVFDGKFKLANATSSQLREKLEAMGISGDTVRKAQAFFVAAAKDAGEELSQFLSAPSPRGAANGSTRQASGAPRRAKKKTKGSAPQTPTALPGDSGSSAIWQAVLAKLPDFDPEWSKEAQADWLAMLKGITEGVAKK